MVTNLLNGCGRKCDAMNSGWKSLLLGGSNMSRPSVFFEKSAGGEGKTGSPVAVG